MTPLGYIAAAVFGAVLTGFAQILLELYKRCDDRRGIASAIAGEISGLLYALEARGMVAHFKALPIALHSDKPPLWPWVFVDTTAEATPIFKAYVDRIGALHERLPERIARFYTIHLAVRTELKIIASDLLKDKPKDVAARIERTLPIWEKASDDAKLLIDDLLALGGVQPE